MASNGYITKLVVRSALLFNYWSNLFCEICLIKLLSGGDASSTSCVVAQADCLGHSREVASEIVTCACPTHFATHKFSAPFKSKAKLIGRGRRKRKSRMVVRKSKTIVTRSVLQRKFRSLNDFQLFTLFASAPA